MFRNSAKLPAALVFLAANSLALAGLAKVYYVEKGVKYHIGDNKYSRSEDKEFLDTYPVVGKEWIQAFKVTEDDNVVVRLGNVWGVDECADCKDMIFLNDH